MDRIVALFLVNGENIQVDRMCDAYLEAMGIYIIMSSMVCAVAYYFYCIIAAIMEL